jgi:hypothetical protein
MKKHFNPVFTLLTMLLGCLKWGLLAGLLIALLSGCISPGTENPSGSAKSSLVTNSLRSTHSTTMLPSTTTSIPTYAEIVAADCNATSDCKTSEFCYKNYCINNMLGDEQGRECHVRCRQNGYNLGWVISSHMLSRDGLGNECAKNYFYVNLTDLGINNTCCCRISP